MPALGVKNRRLFCSNAGKCRVKFFSPPALPPKMHNLITLLGLQAAGVKVVSWFHANNNLNLAFAVCDRRFPGPGQQPV